MNSNKPNDPTNGVESNIPAFQHSSIPHSALGGTPMVELANRIARRFKHLKKWAKRTEVGAFRVYDRDIPDQPLVVEWFSGWAVAWAFDRTRNETPEQEDQWLHAVRDAVAVGLALKPEQVVLKRRRKQEDRQHGGQYGRLNTDPGQSIVHTVSEHGLRFLVNLTDHLDTGLFLDHRPMRAWVGANAKGKRVLNLFAYTGAFTVHARAGGALTTATVDLSGKYLEWARSNALANGHGDDPAHTVHKADARIWLDQAATDRGRYDLIICDPPTFSNSTAMETDFEVERDHVALLWQCWNVLAPGGVVIFSTNQRKFKLAERGLPPFAGGGEVTKESVPEDCLKNPHRCWRWIRG